MTTPLPDPLTALGGLLDEPVRRPCLLVVDDQPINIQTLYRIFSPDYQVLMATSGAKALELCRDDPPDLVLLDVVMPDMDGHEVCRQLQADHATRNIPVIFVTAHSEAAEETRGLAMGAVDFIAKPINPAVVRARVHTHVTLKRQADLLRRMVFIDGLTGVCNRRCFDEQLVTEWRRALRRTAPLALLMLDVDHFKRYNDRHGHQAGDDCLRRVAGAIRSGLRRPGDSVARYGGEEFTCLLPDTGLDGAMEVARRIAQQLRTLQLPHADAAELGGLVTLSIGVAAGVPQRHDDPARLLALADAQLYLAKRNGRARICGQDLGDAAVPVVADDRAPPPAAAG